MLRRIAGVVVAMALVVALGGVCRAAEKVVNVFVAASAQDAFKDIATAFEKETGIKILLNPASSGVLAQQIDKGAEAGVFLSASKKWVDFLNEKKLLETDKVLLNNKLVLICPVKSTPAEVKFAADFDFAAAFKGKLSIGDPAYVPAGKYAEQALTKLDWLKALTGRLIKSKDVRAAMRVVEMGGADFGIVYTTDAQAPKEVKICGVFPEDTHKPIVYPVGLCKGASAEAKQFYDYLSNEASGKVFAGYGFTLPPVKK